MGEPVSERVGARRRWRSASGVRYRCGHAHVNGVLRGQYMRSGRMGHSNDIWRRRDGNRMPRMDREPTRMECCNVNHDAPLLATAVPLTQSPLGSGSGARRAQRLARAPTGVVGYVRAGSRWSASVSTHLPAGSPRDASVTSWAPAPDEHEPREFTVRFTHSLRLGVLAATMAIGGGVLCAPVTAMADQPRPPAPSRGCPVPGTGTVRPCIQPAWCILCQS